MNHFQTTPVAATICPRCQQPILTGWAEGMHSRADPIPLNHTGLIAGILTGRPTYRLTKGALVELDAHRIRATNIRGPMVPAHKCGQPPPMEHREPTTLPENEPPTEEIPF